MTKAKAVLFDLDGTLLPMDQDVFLKDYFKRLAMHLVPYGYDPKKLIDAVMKGTYAMVGNQGKETNETVFWQTFYSILGEGAKAHLPVYDAFYRDEFGKVQASCGYAKESAEIVRFLKEKGYTVALATNPVFPEAATRHRIAWAGLSFDDFAIVTTYENSRYCKPSPEYYIDVCKAIGVTPEECVMVGNDVSDDMIAETVGMKVFLLTDCLINGKGTDISRYPKGGFVMLKEFLGAL